MRSGVPKKRAGDVLRREEYLTRAELDAALAELRRGDPPSISGRPRSSMEREQDAAMIMTMAMVGLRPGGSPRPDLAVRRRAREVMTSPIDLVLIGRDGAYVELTALRDRFNHAQERAGIRPPPSRSRRSPSDTAPLPSSGPCSPVIAARTPERANDNVVVDRRAGRV
jgi:hypothetical protein